jgi:hypothetical protein
VSTRVKKGGFSKQENRVKKENWFDAADLQ